MLQLKSISIPYISVAQSAIWHQELVLHKGDLMHIKAASGKGKSSLIQCIYGLNNAFDGDILFHGKSSKKLSTNDWCDLRNCFCNCHLRAYFCSLKEKSSTSNSFSNINWQR